MEFLDEESRPRFLFQSKASSSSSISEPETLKVNKTLASICVFVSILLIILSVFYLQSETLKFILIWLSISLIVGPFAPISYTGGDIRVGQGELLEQLDEDRTEQFDDSRKRVSNRKQKTRKSEDLALNSNSTAPVIGTGINSEKSKLKTEKTNGSVIHEEREWIDEDFELLKKQISKHPVGEPKRWELIAKAFQGRHGLESVIKMGKSLPERKPGIGDSFSQFLKHRKPLDKRLVEEVNGELDLVNNEGNKDSSNWSSGEDIALLNALKAFPKEVSMRWEKIAAAVPGKTKACCMKRVAELKKDFRSSKSSGDS